MSRRKWSKRRQKRGCLRRRPSVPDPSGLRAAVFIDRDGTIIEEVGYLNHISRFRMFPFVAGALQHLNEAGYPVIVLSNQSGVARGYFPESLVGDVTALMSKQL